jgi:hypothetical protein
MGPDMIKDILVGLPTGASPKAVVDYAVSVAAAFEAHLVGLAFTYEPVVPGTVFDGVAASIIETYRQESEKTGRASIKEFNDAVKRAGLSAESHLLESGTGSSGELFAQFARHFDQALEMGSGGFAEHIDLALGHSGDAVGDHLAIGAKGDAIGGIEVITAVAMMVMFMAFLGSALTAVAAVTAYVKREDWTLPAYRWTRNRTGRCGRR